MNTSITGCCIIILTLGDTVYNGIHLSVLKDLCSDMIFGHNFQKLHKSLAIDIGGTKPNPSSRILRLVHSLRGKRAAWLKNSPTLDSFKRNLKLFSSGNGSRVKQSYFLF